MIIPFLNLDVTWLVQILVFLAYLGMAYLLVLEYLYEDPFGQAKTKGSMKTQEPKGNEMEKSPNTQTLKGI